jgi:hypothetical protein
MKCETAEGGETLKFNYVLKCKIGDPLGASRLNFALFT